MIDLTYGVNKIGDHTVVSHVIGDEAEQAYCRSDAFDRRLELMEAWASCTPRPKRGSHQAASHCRSLMRRIALVLPKS